MKDSNAEGLALIARLRHALDRANRHQYLGGWIGVAREVEAVLADVPEIVTMDTLDGMATLRAEHARYKAALQRIASASCPQRDPLQVVGGSIRAADLQFESIRLIARAALDPSQP